MNKIVPFTVLFIIVLSFKSKAQTAPYSLSPIWVFGNKAQFDFTSGSLSQTARADGVIANEGASTLCTRAKSLMVYDNNVRVAGNNHAPLANPNIINGSSSSTQGGIILPNPSNAAGTQFFWITGNAESTYPEEPLDALKQGIKVYSGSQSGGSVTNPSLVSTLISDPSSPSEPLYTSSDGNYGYYIFTANVNGGGSGAYYFNYWNLSSAGVIGGLNNFTVASNWYSNQYQGSIKVNRCQTKIAFVMGTQIAVFNFDRTTGTIGSVIKSITGVSVGGGSKLYGCEFSANGDYLYVSTLGGFSLIRVDLTVAGTTTGLTTPFAGTASGSLQIGPDDIIYISNGLDASSVTSVGTITNANTGGTYNATGVALANSSSVRLGMSNIPWLNPQKPTATIVNNSCGSYTFTPVFLTHFNDAITYNKAIWDFGDGSAIVTNSGASATNPVTHVYNTGSTGNKTITLTLTDGTCSQDWVGTVVQNVPCILPVELISFDAHPKNEGVNLTWSTATEINNDYFEVQRSIDGVSFQTIATVQGNGNSNHMINYSYFDSYPLIGKSYYKLVQHDFDGKSEDSKVVTVDLNKSSLTPVSISPNPFSDSFVLTKWNDEQATVLVYDIVGRILEQKISPVSETILHLGSSLSNGTYIVEYITTERSYTTRVEKQ